MTLHRTPIHHEALGKVRDGRIRWRLGKAVGGGWFTYTDGQLADQSTLVALWELLRERLIEKRGPGVFLTDAGHARLSEWAATRRAAMEAGQS